MVNEGFPNDDDDDNVQQADDCDDYYDFELVDKGNVFGKVFRSQISIHYTSLKLGCKKRNRKQCRK